MSIEIVRPASTPAAGGSTPVGGASLHAVTSDDSLSTYIELEGAASTIAFDPPAEIPVAYTVRMNASRGSGAPSTVEMVTNGTDPRILRTNVHWGGPIYISISPSHLPPAAFDADDPRISITNRTGFTLPQIYELYLDVYGLDDPTVNVDTPTGTLTESNLPTVGWTPTLDADGGGQTLYEVKVFTDAIFDAGGFDASTSPVVDESGELVGNETEHTIETVLDDGTYHAAVRIAQTVNGEAVWSAWDFSEFAIDVPPLGLPTFIVIPEAERFRIRLDAIPYSLLDNQTLEVDRSEWFAEGTGTIRERVVTLLDKDPLQGTWFLGVDTPGTSDTEGAQTASLDSVASTLHRYRAHVLAPEGALMEAAYDERASGNSTIGTTEQDFTGTGDWQVVEGSRMHGATGPRSRLRVHTDATLDLSFGIEMVQIVGDGKVLTDFLQIQKRQAGTSVWYPLRTPRGDGLVSDAETAYDSEAANGIAMEYRTRGIHEFASGERIYTAWVPGSDFVVWEEWVIKHPFLPELNMAVNVRSQPTRRKTVASGVHRVLGRSSPIVIFDTRYCWEGQITFRCDNDEDRTRLQEITADGSPLLVQAPSSQYWKPTWLQFVNDYEQARVIDTGWMPYSFDTFDWVQVRRPTGLMEEWPTAFLASAEEDA